MLLPMITYDSSTLKHVPKIILNYKDAKILFLVSFFTNFALNIFATYFFTLQIRISYRFTLILNTLIRIIKIY